MGTTRDYCSYMNYGPTGKIDLNCRDFQGSGSGLGCRGLGLKGYRLSAAQEI